MLVLRSLLFYLLLIIITSFFALLSLCTALLPFKYHYWIITRWSYLTLISFHQICRIKVNIQGLEHIQNISNGVILCKHQSAWETIFMQQLFPLQTWVLKKELLAIPFFGWALKTLEPIAIDRNKSQAAKQLIDVGTKALQAGKWVVIFPEGTRVPPNKKRKYAKSGTALAVAAGYPIIPITHNAGLCWPQKGWLKPGTITVVIGKPIFPAPNVSIEQLNQDIAEWIENNIPSC